MPPRLRRGASTARDVHTAVRELHAAIFDPEAALMVFFASPEYDLDALGAALAATFGPDAPLIGCTTAGEIGPLGYLVGSLSGLSLSGSGLAAVTERVDGLAHFEIGRGDLAAGRALARLAARGKRTGGMACFGFLLADGLSMQEEALVSAIYRNLGDIQLFGGSAGDGLRFGTTRLYHEGRFHEDCALFTLVSSAYPFRVFKTEHFVATEHKLVVTGADPVRRIVTEINGEPAAREYAALLGLSPAGLSPQTFAAHPLVVRLGGQTFVRSIQKVNPDDSLTFFCAIDEGIVLTIARGIDLLQNLESTFAGVEAELGTPGVILGCDCVLRALEADEKGLRARLGELFVRYRVVGFSTYGEQWNAMHVNQTFTGVAIGGGGG